MSDMLKTPSPLGLRAELEEMVCRDLLGPAGGPEEEVAERNVRGRYIVGLLAPRGRSVLPEEEDDASPTATSEGTSTTLSSSSWCRRDELDVPRPTPM